MNIDKFKLIAGGYGGIEVWRTEPVKKGNIISLDLVHRTRKIQIDRQLREQIQSLRYFYLALTRHWVPPFNQYFDFDIYKPKPIEENTEMKSGERLMRALWNDTTITGVTTKENGFVITGFIEVVPEKKLGISTPFITAEDDFAFYNEAMEGIGKIHEAINMYLYHNILPLSEAREDYMLETGKTKLSAEEENTILESLVEKFHEQGAIVLMGEGDYQNALMAPEETELHQGKTVINKERYPLAEEEIEEQIIYPENKGKFSEETLVGGETMIDDNI